MTAGSEKYKDLERLIGQLAPDSPRRRLIEAAQAFKSNWVTFGEYLTRVASEKIYLEWGYQSFEEYCRDEIRIKKNTAIKLTNAYFFATQTEPSIADSFVEKGIPELDVVQFLHKTRLDDNCTDEIFNDLRERALDKGQTGPTLARHYRQMTAPAIDSARGQQLEQTVALTGKLLKRLQNESDIPEHFFDYLDEIVAFLTKRISTASKASSP